MKKAQCSKQHVDTTANTRYLRVVVVVVVYVPRGHMIGHFGMPRQDLFLINSAFIMNIVRFTTFYYEVPLSN